MTGKKDPYKPKTGWTEDRTAKASPTESERELLHCMKIKLFSLLCCLGFFYEEMPAILLRAGKISPSFIKS